MHFFPNYINILIIRIDFLPFFYFFIAINQELLLCEYDATGYLEFLEIVFEACL